VHPESLHPARTSGNSDVLELKGLTRCYGDLVALDDLSFTVAEGQLFGFVGPNGAGKTTAMRIILGVLEPDAGEVRWRGRLMDDEIRRRIGYLPEDHGQTIFQRCASVPLMRKQLRLLEQGVGRQVEQPGSDHAAPPPDLGDRGGVDVVTVIVRVTQRATSALAVAESGRTKAT
jgi:ABC-type dipeptide/oligopeptide/nickel transport system ATPase component